MIGSNFLGYLYPVITYYISSLLFRLYFIHYARATLCQLESHHSPLVIPNSADVSYLFTSNDARGPFVRSIALNDDTSRVIKPAVS